MKSNQQNKPKRKKISETFLLFAAPILSDMPEEATPAEIRRSEAPNPCADEPTAGEAI